MYINIYRYNRYKMNKNNINIFSTLKIQYFYMLYENAIEENQIMYRIIFKIITYN